MGAITRVGLALMLGLLGVTSGCEATERCGDGVVDDAEACDDGNQLAGDGCSASCEPDDDRRTPGDDRAGYFVCELNENVITCGPGTVCCMSAGPSCVSAEEGCADPFTVAACDGPEDCAEGSHCELFTHGIGCTSSEISGSFCHTDADCTQPPSPWLLPGPCSSAGMCQFGVVPPEQVEL